MFENGQLTVLNIRDILPNRFQPRIKFDEEKLEELAESINKYGVIQPIVVRPVGSKFEIIAGERRFKASRLSSKSTIPAIVVNLSDKDSEEIALLENVQRQELSPIEEAVSYKRILDMGYITQEELAKKIGKSQSTIANKIRLLNLDDEVQSYLLNNKISERHARSLLRISDKEKQVQMLHRIVSERLTVKQTDKEIAAIKDEEAKEINPIDLDIPIKVSNNSQDSNEIETLFGEEDERGNSMDIDRIMREAKDINGNSVSETKDISGLMSPSGIDVQQETQPSLQTNDNSSLEANKFINVAQPTVEKPVPSTPVNNGVTFDSMFNQHIISEPATNNTSMLTPPVMESSSVNSNESQNVSIMPSLGVDSSIGVPVNNDNLNDEVISSESTGSSVNMSSVNPEFNSVNNVPNQGGIPEITPVVPSVSDGSNMYVNSEPMITPETKKAISTAVANALKKYNEDKARKTIASTIPSPVAPVSEIASDVSIPDTNIIAGDTLSEYANPTPVMASTITQDVKQVNNQAKFAEIVKLLRDCADKIEQNGYFVNVDELDLGNQYKVTFTINKE